MTTIAYKDGVIAYDSRVTIDGVVLSDDAVKCVAARAALFFFASDVSHEDAFIRAWLDGHAIDGECDVEAIVVTGVNVCLGSVAGGKLYRMDLNYSWAIGSGAAYAIGAMDAGASALEAVEIAKHRDPMTGGEVRVHILGGVNDSEQ